MGSFDSADNHFRILNLFLRTPVCEEILMEHARKEIALENIFFWRAVTSYLDQYSDESIEQRSQREQDMVALYLREGSDYEINISSKLRDAILLNPSFKDRWESARDEIGRIILDGQVLRLSSGLSDRVRRSWKRSVELTDNKLMKLFYDELFTLEPAIRPLFKENNSKQERMFAKVMGTTVSLLDNFGNLFALLTDIGKKHKRIPMKPEYFDLVGKALINTIARVLGKEFDRETQKSWCFVYALMATIMMLSIDQASIDHVTLNLVNTNYPYQKTPSSMSSEFVFDSEDKGFKPTSWMPFCGCGKRTQ